MELWNLPKGDKLLLDDLMLRWYYQHQVQMDLPKVVELVVNITFLSYLKTTPQLLCPRKLGCGTDTIVLVMFCWWLYNDDRFKMLVAKWSCNMIHVDDASTSWCWHFTLLRISHQHFKAVIKKTVSIIPHQHWCSLVIHATSLRVRIEIHLRWNKKK